jgi:hypothetical protein
MTKVVQVIIIIIQVYCPMESKDYERHSEAITIPPARMLPCAVTITYPFGSSGGLRTRTCIQPCKQERV